MDLTTAADMNQKAILVNVKAREMYMVDNESLWKFLAEAVPIQREMEAFHAPSVVHKLWRWSNEHTQSTLKQTHSTILLEEGALAIKLALAEEKNPTHSKQEQEWWKKTRCEAMVALAGARRFLADVRIRKLDEDLAKLKKDNAINEQKKRLIDDSNLLKEIPETIGIFEKARDMEFEKWKGGELPFELGFQYFYLGILHRQLNDKDSATIALNRAQIEFKAAEKLERADLRTQAKLSQQLIIDLLIDLK